MHRVFFALIFLLATTTLRAQTELLFVTAEYPTNDDSKASELVLDTSLISEIFAQGPYRVRIEFYPFRRAVAMARKGDADGLFTLWRTPEREQWLAFSNSMFAGKTVFIKHRDKPISYRQLNDLRAYRIAEILGYAYPEFYRSARLRRTVVADPVEAMQMLRDRQVDLAVLDLAQASQIIKLYDARRYHDYDYLEPALEITGNHLGIPRRRADADAILAFFNRRLAELKAKGRVQQLQSEYGFKTLQPAH